MPQSHGALMPLRYDVIFAGRVQGVNFRWTTCRVAQRFDVTDWVRNERDGSARCVAEGDPAELDALVKAVQQAMAGYIEETRVSRADAQGDLEGFGRQY